MWVLTALQLIAGVAMLTIGGDQLVKGAEGIAGRLGMSPLVIGLTVVSMATSAPEFAVTMGAVWRGDTGLALGNVVGSNTANVLLVLGLSACIAPLLAARRMLQVDLPTVIGMSVLVLVLGLDGRVGVLDGVLLFAVFAVHLVRTVRSARSETADETSDQTSEAAAPQHDSPLTGQLLRVVAGTGLLVAGAASLVAGATSLATAMGVSDLIVGLTVVSVGTSLPELTASVIAVRRGQGDLAVGNAIGSNLANIGLVLAVPAMIGGGIPVPDSALSVDLPVMIASAALLLPIAFTGGRISRLEGGFLLTCYAAYTAYLLLMSSGHDAQHGFGRAAVVIAVLAAVVIGADVISQLRRRATSGRPPEPSPGAAPHD